MPALPATARTPTNLPSRVSLNPCPSFQHLMCCNTYFRVATQIGVEGDARMSNLLIVNSSPRSSSVSRKLTRQFAEDWKSLNPAGRLVERDLSDGTIPYL